MVYALVVYGGDNVRETERDGEGEGEGDCCSSRSSVYK